MKLLLALILIIKSVYASDFVSGMNLTELGNFKYDAAGPGEEKTAAQIAVDHIYELGARHIVLNPVATMQNPRGFEVKPNTPASERRDERGRYLRLIKYIKSKGMSVGLRPIFFVVKPDGTFPYVEIDARGQKKVWWHGNIQPKDPEAWFESFKAFLDSYILIGRIAKVEEFTIGAELYSMTVGIEDQWKEHPFGFPKKWLEILNYTRAKLGDDVRIMYDINFTDDSVSVSGNLKALGGELERWRYRIVDLAEPSDPEEYKTWRDLVDFWNGLDGIGIDMYRSLASTESIIPQNYNSLVSFLQVRADQYAFQMDTVLTEIEFTVGKMQYMYFKEVGFRSVDKGFINPFEYETGFGEYNEEHQAASYQALKNAFWDPEFPWFKGGSLWDVSVSPLRNTGVGDTGFSPVGKPLTTEVLRNMFGAY